MTTVALLGLDLILGLLAVALWTYAAVRAETSGLRWALAGLLVLLARLVTVLVLAGRGWELAAERVTVGVPLALLAAAAAIGLLIRARRHGRTGSVAARVALWSAAGASAVSLVLTSVIGYPGGPGAAGHDHSHHHGGVSVTELRTPPVGTSRKVELVAQTQAVTLPSGRVVDAWTFGSLPGPTLTARVGETLEVTLRNRDITTGVTLHWHGLSVPNGEDGVAGVTQDAVLPRERFVYRFRAEQPGTFWYHTHQRGREGIARGLYGALVVQPEGGVVAGVDLVLPFHTIGKTAILGASDQLQREVVAAGTPIRLRLVNTDQQPRRFALNGAAFRVMALDGVDLNGPTDVTDRAVRVPAGGRYDLAFTMPANPVRLSVEGARQVGLVLAGSADGPEPEATVAKATFDPTTYGSPRPVPDMTREPDVSTTIVLDRLPRILNGRPALAQTVNGGVYPDIPPIMVAEGDLVRMRVVNRSFETHPMHPHGHHVLVLSVNGRAPTGSPLWLDTFDVQPGEVWEVALRADNPGIWMDHCHNLEHATSGMMFHLAYAGVSTPFSHGPGSPNNPSSPPTSRSTIRTGGQSIHAARPGQLGEPNPGDPPAAADSLTERNSTMSDEQVVPESRGVAVDLLATVDLGPEIQGLEGRQLRMRMVTIEPGGVFGPTHDHKGRPGTVYVLRGTITDHRDGIATDYGPGVGWPEDRNTLHWLENRGSVPAVEISVDVVRNE